MQYISAIYIYIYMLYSYHQIKSKNAYIIARISQTCIKYNVIRIIKLLYFNNVAKVRKFKSNSITLQQGVLK